jgi:hypothetical protein
MQFERDEKLNDALVERRASSEGREHATSHKNWTLDVLLLLRKGNREIGNSYSIAFLLQIVMVNRLSDNGVVGRLIRSHGDFFRRDLF